ncbi:MAG: hypothetical protein JXK93_10525 [Sphaerochaetaceae bacterium]|nr:hypothetical protein [Sphaerochaetaceae bacterium]
MSTTKGAIGQMKESGLHRDLKELYQKRMGGETEVLVDGYIVDLRSEHMICEIQTGNFSRLHRKLMNLLPEYPVRVVYPLVRDKLVIVCDGQGHTIRNRRSPVHREIAFAATELMRIPDLVMHPNFSLDLISVSIEEIRVDDGKGSWRRNGVSITDRRLLSADEPLTFTSPHHYLQFLPYSLCAEFTNRDISQSSSLTPSQAAKLSYFLRKINVIETAGKRGRSLLFTRVL